MKSHSIAIISFVLFFTTQLTWGQNNESITGLQSAASDSNKPYIVELSAEWCGFCKLFERETLKDETVNEYLSQNYFLATMDSEEGEGLMLSNKYKIKALPALLFFNSKGDLMGKMIGYQDAEAFLYSMQKYKKKYDKKHSK